jgi:hypothetical protein
MDHKAAPDLLGMIGRYIDLDASIWAVCSAGER